MTLLLNTGLLLLMLLGGGCGAFAFAPMAPIRTSNQRVSSSFKGKLRGNAHQFDVLLPIQTRLQVSFSSGDHSEEENKNKLEVSKLDHGGGEIQQQVDESEHVGLLEIVAWISAISAFVLINNFVGPWPSPFMAQVPERVWFLLHMLGGMLFGGGILLTTATEYLVAQNKKSSVLQFWFDKVPLLDTSIVLPGLTLAMISGVGLAIEHYNSLSETPRHIQYVFWALVAFASWWAVTDLTTQGSALNAINEHAAAAIQSEGENNEPDIPPIVMKRTISNVVSCLLVLLIYSIMVLKPGTLHA